jgi:hypothetical protein
MIPPDSHSVFVYRPTLKLLRNELSERERRIHASAGTSRQCRNWNKECKRISHALEGVEVSDCCSKSAGAKWVRIVVQGAGGYSATTFINPDFVDIKQEKRFLKKFLRQKCKPTGPLTITSTPVPSLTDDKWDGKPTSILMEINGVERELFFENMGCAFALNGCKGQRVTARAVGSRETARIWVLGGPRNDLDIFNGHEDVSFATVAAAG